MQRRLFLKAIRELRGLSQYHVAAKVRIPQSRLSLIETGQREPRREEAEAIARLLDVDVHLMFSPDVEK